MGIGARSGLCLSPGPELESGDGAARSVPGRVQPSGESL